MGREEFCLNFSCLALKYKFLFHQECFVSFLQESVILEDTAFLLAWWTFQNNVVWCGVSPVFWNNVVME